VAEVYYLELGDFCRIAAEVLGTTPDKIARLPRSSNTSPEITHYPTATSAPPSSPSSASWR
jgi:hypothetical protein